MNPFESGLTSSRHNRKRAFTRDLMERRERILSSVRWDPDLDPLPPHVEQGAPTSEESERGRLDERAQEQLAEIELALAKMDCNVYGICEACRNPIALRRLRNLPESRLCLGCEREREQGRIELVPPEEALESLKNEAAEMEDAPADLLLQQRLLELLGRRGARLSPDLAVSVRHGVTFLDGRIPSEDHLHQIMEHLAESMDELDCSVVVNRIEIDPRPSE